MLWCLNIEVFRHTFQDTLYIAEAQTDRRYVLGHAAVRVIMVPAAEALPGILELRHDLRGVVRG